MDKSSLGDRMKGYEQVAQQTLTGRTPLIIRLDGKAFHTWTRGLKKPFDDRMIDTMNWTMTALMGEIMGAKVGYMQSDEISILVCDYDRFETQPWFGKKLQKIVSVAASIATAEFNNIAILHKLIEPGCEYNNRRFATFDARAFTLPKEEVNNYFVWRQQDAIRNSIQGLGQSVFSQKELHGKSCSDVKEMLIAGNWADWNDLNQGQRQGWVSFIPKGGNLEKGINPGLVGSDLAPIFAEDHDFVGQHVYAGEQ